MGSVPCENYFCLRWRWPYLDNLIGEEQAEQYAAVCVIFPLQNSVWSNRNFMEWGWNGHKNSAHVV